MGSGRGCGVPLDPAVQVVDRPGLRVQSVYGGQQHRALRVQVRVQMQVVPAALTYER